MTSILPTIPRFVFTIFEPLSLIAGAIGAYSNPSWFVAEQIVMSPPETLSPNSIVVTLQLGNLYLLLAMVGISIMYTSTEPRVVQNYIWALLIADIGHLYVTYYILEYERFVDIANWNAMAYGNILTTTLLFFTRAGYLLGIFGPSKPQNVSAKKLA